MFINWFIYICIILLSCWACRNKFFLLPGNSISLYSHYPALSCLPSLHSPHNIVLSIHPHSHNIPSVHPHSPVTSAEGKVQEAVQQIGFLSILYQWWSQSDVSRDLAKALIRGNVHNWHPCDIPPLQLQYNLLAL